jgi:hypothetical protein
MSSDRLSKCVSRTARQRTLLRSASAIETRPLQRSWASSGRRASISGLEKQGQEGVITAGVKQASAEGANKWDMQA